jgi:hypothetical protein
LPRSLARFHPTGSWCHRQSWGSSRRLSNPSRLDYSQQTIQPSSHPAIQPSSHPAIQPSTSIANEVVVAIPVRRRGRNADRTRDLRVNCSPPPPPLRLARRLQKLRAYAESCFQTSFSHHLTTTTDIELSRRCGRAERVCDDRTTTIAATRASRKP